MYYAETGYMRIFDKKVFDLFAIWSSFCYLLGQINVILLFYMGFYYTVVAELWQQLCQCVCLCVCVSQNLNASQRNFVNTKCSQRFYYSLKGGLFCSFRRTRDMHFNFWRSKWVQRFIKTQFGGRTSASCRPLGIMYLYYRLLLLACNAQPMDHIWSLSVCFIYLM